MSKGATDRLPAELRYVLAAAGGAAALRPDGIGWPIVAQGLERHGLLRLVGDRLIAQGAVTPDQAAQLRTLQQAQAVTALTQLGETLRLCGLLKAAGIRFLLVKGVALSIQLFGRPDTRSSKDIDILVEPGAVRRIDAILTPLGYRRPAIDLAKDELAGHVPKEIAYLNHDAGMMVEVHTRLTENAGLFTPDFETLWASRETVTTGGRELPAMGRAQLALYLAVHGAKHNWARLMWLLDIAALTPSPSAIEAALAQAREHALEPVLLHSLWMLHSWFGHPVPAEVIARAEADRVVRILNRLTIRFHCDARWHEQAPRRSWRRFYLNSVLGRITAYAMKPGTAYWRAQMSLDLVSPADRTIVTLPDRFGWGYAVLRPFGWIVRRLRG